jgi:prophage antirepressor-like protein
MATSKEGEAGVCLDDICAAVGIQKSRNVVYRLSGKDAFTMGTLTNGGEQQMWYVTESGLYTVLVGSRKPLAKELTAVLLSKFADLRKQATVPAVSDNIVSLQAIKILIDNQILLEQRMDKYEANQQAVNAILAPVKEVSTRLKINQIVRTYAQHHDKDYRECFKTLYYEFKYRYGIDLVGRTHNNGNKTVLDTAEQLGCLDDLFTLAVALFVGK